MHVYNWLDLADDYNHGLVLGNGASIAFDKNFSYRSLREEAQRLGHITEQLSKIFAHLDTTDFELVLRVLWHAKTVNDALQIHDERTDQAYSDVRVALIETVRSVHADYQTVADRLTRAAEFMGRFSTVVSLSYDLLAYWSIQAGNDVAPNRFKDCFIGGQFQYDWERFREPYGNSGAATLLFFPHDNLVLGSDIGGAEAKVRAGEFSNLLQTLTSKWQEGEITPIFVSEGTTEQKLHAIRRSAYLSTVYEEVLQDLGESVVIYGWSLSGQDDHLLKEICRGRPMRFAVSVRTDSSRSAEYCARVERKLRDGLGANRFELVFFEATSDGCWVAA